MIDELTANYNKLIGIKIRLENSIKTKKEELKTKKYDWENHIKARIIINNILEQTHDRLKKRIESLVTMAMQSVYPNRNFEFKLLFEQKRNKTECTPAIYEDGEVYDDILNDLGGGIVPIISFALRIVFWSMQNPQSRNTFIMDEPLKGSLSGKELDRAINMYEEVAKKIGIQLILITHYSDLIDVANKVFKVEYADNKSIVKTIK